MTELIGKDRLFGHDGTGRKILVLGGCWAFDDVGRTAVAAGVAPELLDAHDGQLGVFERDGCVNIESW